MLFFFLSHRYNAGVSREWHLEQRFQMAWTSPNGAEDPRLYRGTIVGSQAPQADTGLLPSRSLRVEWDKDRGRGLLTPTVEGVDPWAIEMLDEIEQPECDLIGRKGEPTHLMLQHMAIREAMGGKREKGAVAEMLAAARNRVGQSKA